MREDDLLKDVFRRASHGEPAVGDAFSRFERHERRAALTRFFTVAVIAVVSAVLLSRLLPGVSTGPEREGFIPAGEDQSELTNSNRYTDAIGDFRVNYPIDWIGRGQEGHFAEIFPQFGLEASENLSTMRVQRLDCGSRCGAFGSRYTLESAEQFFIKIEVLRPGCREVQPGCARLAGSKELDAELRKGGARVAHATDFVAAKQVDRVETIFPRSPELVRRGGEDFPPHYWCSGCRMREYIVPWSAERTLYVRVVSPDADDFQRFNSLINFTIENIKPYRPAATS